MRRRIAAYWSRRNLPTRAAVVATATTAMALILVVGFVVAVQVLVGGRMFYPDEGHDLFDAAARAKVARVDPERYDFTGMGAPERVTITVRPRFHREIVAQAKVTDQARVELTGSADNTRAVAFLAASALLTLILVGLATWLAVGRALRSVAAIRERVDTIGAEELNRRVPVPAARDEIARLAETMNRMLDRLAESAARQRRFIADASHEPRTPVATVKATTEVALAHRSIDAREVLGEVHGEVGRLEALVADLLDLARPADGGNRGRGGPVDLDDIVLQEVRTLRRLHADVVVDAKRVSGATRPT